MSSARDLAILSSVARVSVVSDTEIETVPLSIMIRMWINGVFSKK